MKDTFLDTANSVLGRRKKRKNKPWISEDTLKLIEARRSLKKYKLRTSYDRHTYYQAKAEVQRHIRQDKKAWLEDQCAQVEQGLQHNRSNSKNAFKIAKKLPKHRNIHDEMGKVLSDLDDIKARWKRYTESLYEDKNSTQHRDSASTEATDQDKAMPILIDEVRDAIRRLPRDKAAGYDNLPAELLTLDSSVIERLFCTLCNRILDTDAWPKDWRRLVFVTVPKVTGTMKCEEHRTIALISHASKILLRILLNRMQKTANEQIADVQIGFRKGVGTRDQIFNPRVIMEKANEAFLDYKKAFDTVKHDKLWNVLKGMGTVYRARAYIYCGMGLNGSTVNTLRSQSGIGDYRLVQDRQRGSTRMPHITFVIQLLFRASDEGIS